MRKAWSGTLFGKSADILVIKIWTFKFLVIADYRVRGEDYETRDHGVDIIKYVEEDEET